MTEVAHRRRFAYHDYLMLEEVLPPFRAGRPPNRDGSFFPFAFGVRLRCV